MHGAHQSCGSLAVGFRDVTLIFFVESCMGGGVVLAHQFAVGLHGVCDPLSSHPPAICFSIRVCVAAAAMKPDVSLCLAKCCRGFL